MSRYASDLLSVRIYFTNLLFTCGLERSRQNSSISSKRTTTFSSSMSSAKTCGHMYMCMCMCMCMCM